MPSTTLLLRHATAAQGSPTGRDADRPLTDHGQQEAAGVGNWLRASELQVDLVLCSPAVRTRQTLEQLSLGGEVPVELVTGLYRATAALLVELVGGLDAATVLVVGHAPAVPDAVELLADPSRSSAAALAFVARRYPPGTAAQLSWTGSTSTALVEVRIPDGRNGYVIR